MATKNNEFFNANELMRECFDHSHPVSLHQCKKPNINQQHTNNSQNRLGVTRTRTSEDSKFSSQAVNRYYHRVLSQNPSGSSPGSFFYDVDKLLEV